MEPTPELKELTQQQVEIIRKTWETPSAKPCDSGMHILYIFFERFPHNQQKFFAFKNTPLENLKETPAFQSHSSKIINLFSSVIDVLDKDPEMNEIKRIVADMGRSHARRRITKKSFNELREVLVEVLSDVCQLDDDGAVAWIALLDILYHIIFECLDGRLEQFDLVLNSMNSFSINNCLGNINLVLIGILSQQVEVKKMGNVITNCHSEVMTCEELILTPELKALDENQIAIIKRTWEIPSAKSVDSGEHILYLFFDRYPHNQLKFAAFRTTPLLMLKGMPGFRSHASKIMNVFSIAIDALGRENGMEEIVKLLNEVGKSHARRKIPKKALNELRVIIVEVLSDICHLDEEGVLAWNNLLDTVYHVLFECLDGK